MKNFFESKTVYKGIILALLIIVGFFIWREVNSQERYYAVYLTSGDVYFGKLHFFPSLIMNDAYFLQADSTYEEGGYVLSRFSNALWQPEGTIKFNRDHVLWIAELKQDSKAVAFIRQEGDSKSSLENASSFSVPQVDMPSVPKLIDPALIDQNSSQE
ncbi:MAG: hypothetical protein V1652_03025 [bacterium]